MKEILKRINNNTLLRVASVNSLSIIIRIISGFAVSKFMAIFIGPSGIAISGNLSNFIQSLQSLSSLGFKNGLIKYVAELKENKKQFQHIISSAFLISILIGLVLFIMLFLFANLFSQFVFSSTEYSFLFKVFAFTIPFYTVQVFFIGVINGLKKVNDLVIINIVTYLSSALLIILLIIKNQLDGALIAMVITPLVLFCSLFFRYKVLIYIIKNIYIFSASKNLLLKITSFFSMTLFSGLMFPLIFLLVRSHIINNVGIDEAGYWEGVRKISNYYMLFVYTLFEMYLLPQLAQNKSKEGFRTIVLDFYKTLLPIVFIGLLAVFLLKKLIIIFVFTKEFLPMQDLFLWQLLGDFFRIIFLTISYQFLAKKMIRLYILCEIVYMTFIYFISIYCIDYIGVLGAVKAHALSSLLYMLLLFYVFRKEFLEKGKINN